MGVHCNQRILTCDNNFVYNLYPQENRVLLVFQHHTGSAYLLRLLSHNSEARRRLVCLTHSMMESSAEKQVSPLVAAYAALPAVESAMAVVEDAEEVEDVDIESLDEIVARTKAAAEPKFRAELKRCLAQIASTPHVPAVMPKEVYYAMMNPKHTAITQEHETADNVIKYTSNTDKDIIVTIESRKERDERVRCDKIGGVIGCVLGVAFCIGMILFILYVNKKI